MRTQTRFARPSAARVARPRHGLGRLVSATSLLGALALALSSAPSCKRADESQDPTAAKEGAHDEAQVDPWSQLPPLDVETVRAHLQYLADDAQEGRAPGTDADRRVREHITRAMADIGLVPPFEGGSFEQTFAVTDGVRVVEGKRDMLAAGRKLIAHNLVPWGHSTVEKGPVMSRFIYVGYGLTEGEDWTGDYFHLNGRIENRIVVALAGGPDDPHLDPAKIRPQTKLITARDHGAAGFVLWEPEVASPYPNHGAVHDLQIPAVTVSADGTEALLRIFGVKKPPRTKKGQQPDPHRGLKPGTKSKPQGVIDTPVEPIVLETANVSGILKGNGASSRRIVVGAHMDHLGNGNSHSLAPGEQAVHNGADDNASGVATMLALAQTIAAVPVESRPYDVQFIAFAAEEMGLLGSKHLVEQLGDAASADIVAMINFDMVGRLRDDTVIVAGAGTSSVWPKLLEETAGLLTVKTNEQGYGASDQTSFYAASVPVLHFFTGTHDDYHRPSDDIEKINFRGAAAVGDMAGRLIAAMMSRSLAPDYKKVAASKPMRAGFRVSLGTVPDYAADVDGLQLTGVRPGGPAERAGLQKGDIIQKLGGREIHNMDDYMAAFAVLKPGVEIDVVILRGGKSVTLKLTPDAPRRR